jgi:hypothetical protein
MADACWPVGTVVGLESVAECQSRSLDRPLRIYHVSGTAFVGDDLDVRVLAGEIACP